MSWISFHKLSEDLASRAHVAMRFGELQQAYNLFREAAKAEENALRAIDPNKTRTLGITAVSAVALWYKSGELSKAENVAHRCFALEGLPSFAEEQLKIMLQTIWNEKAQKLAGVSFVAGQVVVSVRGGCIVTGGAPLDLIVEKVQAVQSLFYRTAEFIQGKAFRKKGPPTRDLQERCRPWLFQSVPGSYQFAVAIQKPAQEEMFLDIDLQPESLTDTFLSILKAASEDPDEKMKSVVPEEDYRKTFLKLTRNLAPTGKTFSEIEIRSTKPDEYVIFSSISRKKISDTLRNSLSDASEVREEVSLKGVLRALHLDSDWLELSVGGNKVSVIGVGEAVDDVIGPMVNHDVIVRAVKDKAGRFRFIDIEQDE